MTVENTVSLAALGILGTAVITIGWIAKYGLTSLSKDLREHTKAAVQAAEASNRQTTSNEKLTVAVNSFDTYLRERNGRDNEVHEYLMGSIIKLPDNVTRSVEKSFEVVAAKAVADLTNSIQNISVQKVETQVIKEKSTPEGT